MKFLVSVICQPKSYTSICHKYCITLLQVTPSTVHKETNSYMLLIFFSNQMQDFAYSFIIYIEQL